MVENALERELEGEETSVNIVSGSIHITVSLVAPLPYSFTVSSSLLQKLGEYWKVPPLMENEKCICGSSAQRIPRSHACPFYLDLSH